MNEKNGSWAPVRKKKPTVSWIGAGVKARKLTSIGDKLGSNIEARQKLTNNENDGYRISEIKSKTQQAQQNKLEASLPYVEINMMSKSLVLVLVQDNNAAINLPGGSVQNRLAPPMPIS